MENTAGFTPAKLVSGLHQAFVFRISEQTGHLVGHFVIETGILSIAGNDDIGPISATLQQIVKRGRASAGDYCKIVILRTPIQFSEYLWSKIIYPGQTNEQTIEQDLLDVLTN